MILRASSRLLTLFLTVVYFLANGVLAYSYESNFWEYRKKVALAKPLPIQPPVATKIQKPLPLNLSFGPSNQKDSVIPVFSSLSNQFGSVRKVFNRSSDISIVHFQDVHMNPEAQKNMSHAISQLIEEGKVDLVALEGDFSEINLKSFQEFGHRKTIQKVSDYLLKIQKISGPIHALLNHSGSSVPIIGIDEERYYQANVQSYLEAIKIKETLVRELTNRKNQNNHLKSRYFSPALRALAEVTEKYRQSNLSIDKYLTYLIEGQDLFSVNTQLFLEAVALEKELDFSKVERERARLIHFLSRKLHSEKISELLYVTSQFKSGKYTHVEFYGYLKELTLKNGIDLKDYPEMNNYLQYLAMSDRIDLEEIFNDVASLEKNKYEALATNKQQKKIISESEYIYLIRKLLRFELTPLEWTKYKEISKTEKVIEGIESFEDFYKFAEVRDRAIALNLRRAIDNYKAKSIVLVTGGFHEAGIRKQLDRENLVTFSPKISKVNYDEGTSYLSVFSQQKTPLEKLMQGEKLFTAPRPFLSPFLGLALIPAVFSKVRFKKKNQTRKRRVLNNFHATLPSNTKIEQESTSKGAVSTVNQLDQAPVVVEVELEEDVPFGDAPDVIQHEEVFESSPLVLTQIVASAMISIVLILYSGIGATSQLSLYTPFVAFFGFIINHETLGHWLGFKIAAPKGTYRIKPIGAWFGRKGISFFESTYYSRKINLIAFIWSAFFPLLIISILPYLSVISSVDSIYAIFAVAPLSLSIPIAWQRLGLSHYPSDFDRILDQDYEDAVMNWLKESHYHKLEDLVKEFVGPRKSQKPTKNELIKAIRSVGDKKRIPDTVNYRGEQLKVYRGYYPEYDFLSGNPTGRIVSYVKLHEDGVSHKIGMVALVDTQGRTLLQVRKGADAGKYDWSAQGHVELGHTPLQTAWFESHEELPLDQLGIKIPIQNIRPIQPIGNQFVRTISQFGVNQPQGYFNEIYYGEGSFPTTRTQNHLYTVVVEASVLDAIEKYFRKKEGSTSEVSSVRIIHLDDIGHSVENEREKYTSTIPSFLEDRESRKDVINQMKNFIAEAKFQGKATSVWGVAFSEFIGWNVSLLNKNIDPSWFGFEYIFHAPKIETGLMLLASLGLSLWVRLDIGANAGIIAPLVGSAIILIYVLSHIVGRSWLIDKYSVVTGYVETVEMAAAFSGGMGLTMVLFNLEISSPYIYIIQAVIFIFLLALWNGIYEFHKSVDTGIKYRQSVFDPPHIEFNKLGPSNLDSFYVRLRLIISTVDKLIDGVFSQWLLHRRNASYGVGSDPISQPMAYRRGLIMLTLLFGSLGHFYQPSESVVMLFLVLGVPYLSAGLFYYLAFFKFKKPPGIFLFSMGPALIALLVLAPVFLLVLFSKLIMGHLTRRKFSVALENLEEDLEKKNSNGSIKTIVSILTDQHKSKHLNTEQILDLVEALDSRRVWREMLWESDDHNYNLLIVASILENAYSRLEVENQFEVLEKLVYIYRFITYHRASHLKQQFHDNHEARRNDYRDHIAIATRYIDRKLEKPLFSYLDELERTEDSPFPGQRYGTTHVSFLVAINQILDYHGFLALRGNFGEKEEPEISKLNSLVFIDKAGLDPQVGSIDDNNRYSRSNSELGFPLPKLGIFNPDEDEPMSLFRLPERFKRFTEVYERGIAPLWESGLLIGPLVTGYPFIHVIPWKYFLFGAKINSAIVLLISYSLFTAFLFAWGYYIAVYQFENLHKRQKRPRNVGVGPYAAHMLSIVVSAVYGITRLFATMSTRYEYTHNYHWSQLLDLSLPDYLFEIAMVYVVVHILFHTIWNNMNKSDNRMVIQAPLQGPGKSIHLKHPDGRRVWILVEGGKKSELIERFYEISNEYFSIDDHQKWSFVVDNQFIHRTVDTKNLARILMTLSQKYEIQLFDPAYEKQSMSWESILSFVGIIKNYPRVVFYTSEESYREILGIFMHQGYEIERGKSFGLNPSSFFYLKTNNWKWGIAGIPLEIFAIWIIKYLPQLFFPDNFVVTWLSTISLAFFVLVFSIVHLRESEKFQSLDHSKTPPLVRFLGHLFIFQFYFYLPLYQAGIIHLIIDSGLIYLREKINSFDLNEIDETTDEYLSRFFNEKNLNHSEKTHESNGKKYPPKAEEVPSAIPGSPQQMPTYLTDEPFSPMAKFFTLILATIVVGWLAMALEGRFPSQSIDPMAIGLVFGTALFMVVFTFGMSHRKLQRKFEAWKRFVGSLILASSLFSFVMWRGTVNSWGEIPSAGPPVHSIEQEEDLRNPINNILDETTLNHKLQELNMDGVSLSQSIVANKDIVLPVNKVDQDVINLTRRLLSSVSNGQQLIVVVKDLQEKQKLLAEISEGKIKNHLAIVFNSEKAVVNENNVFDIDLFESALLSNGFNQWDNIVTIRLPGMKIKSNSLGNSILKQIYWIELSNWLEGTIQSPKIFWEKINAARATMISA